jgi:excisionase family DNA binding protein
VTAQAPPPVQELYPGVLFQGDVLRPLYRAVLVGIADARASGYNISLLVEAQQALKSVIGQSNVRKPLPRISSRGQHDDATISVAEAAKLLRRSERHVRRIARAEGLGRRVGRAWLLNRVAVLAYKQELARRDEGHDTTTTAA